MESDNFTICIAQKEDDPSIDSFLKNQFMEGPIKLGIQRGTSYCDSLKIEGDESDTILIKDSINQVKGVATISYRSGMDNHKHAYLHSLKIDNSLKKSKALFLGFKKLKEILKPNYQVYTSILSENDIAKRVLCSGRAGLPYYQYQGLLKTFFITGVKKIEYSSNQTNHLHRDEYSDLTSYWQEHLSTRSLSPSINTHTLENKTGPLILYEDKNILSVKHNGYILGTLAYRDLTQKKTWTIHDYNHWIRLTKPFINLLANLKNNPTLPSPGPMNHILNGSFFFADNNEIALSLINKARYLIGPKKILMLTLHEKDPFYQLLDSHFKMNLGSDLYTLSWDNTETHLNIPFVDTGSL